MGEQVHGHEEWAHRAGLRRYVQHHALAETRGTDLAPTHDGASVAWFDDFEQMRAVFAAPKAKPWSETRFQQPLDVAIGTEKVVVDGPATPEMVKVIYVAKRAPDMSVEEFQRYWFEVHGPLWAKLPGLRRYVQVHGLPEASERTYDPNREGRVANFDGWSEVWFDSLDDLRRALASPERQAASEDGARLFSRPMARVVARETIIVA